jgi:hypothetical protein
MADALKKVSAEASHEELIQGLEACLAEMVKEVP